jgi:hypothetical protein
VANGWGGKRPGSGRPKGSPGLKSEALAERLDEMGYDPAETLVRLSRQAEAVGEIELAIKAAVALMSFRWPKLKETAVGLGLSGSLADRLEQAQARLTISVCSGIDRPPDDAGAIDAAPVPPPMWSAMMLSAAVLVALAVVMVVSAAAPRSAASSSPPPSPEPPAPALTPGKPMPAHAYWSRKREPDVAPMTEYDPWKEPT